ncbi:MAG: protein-methionine-sulfoxide reductase catalytic subunit MsrP, partial [Gemmatimonadaceae bacterium]|nr:protein-methionine-sulfoxide reductase catalytic subunit MsrP [Acetobacteraceae bacterium]
MHIKTHRGWETPERDVTPERFYLARRSLLAGAGAAMILAPGSGHAQGAPRNPRYEAGRDITAERDATTYNNYYEFGTDKSIHRAAQKLVVAPWTIKFDGMVENPRTMDFDDIMKQVKLEERVYRHRCVEGWAMTVPWTGFPLKDLVNIAGPTASARYMVMETLADAKTMPGLRIPAYEWPYVEGVTMAEANNELAFLATGLYGKTIPKQNGAPIRLVLPWKYGFKSVKSIVKVTFTDKKPKTFWEGIQPGEYGFWANVNPEVAHPRWSQATERLLGKEERVPTMIFNGFGVFVAS